MTPNGFFVKFQGDSVLCLLSELCLSLHLFLLAALLTRQRMPLVLETDVSVGYAVPHTWLRQSYLPKLFKESWKKKKVKLAIKYVWHILFNFACNFFLVHWWGFSHCHPTLYLYCSGNAIMVFILVFTIHSMACVWVYCYQPPGLFIRIPVSLYFVKHLFLRLRHC